MRAEFERLAAEARALAALARSAAERSVRLANAATFEAAAARCSA